MAAAREPHRALGRGVADLLLPSRAHDNPEAAASPGLTAGAWSRVTFLEDPVCDGCEGANKNKPVKGMTILWNLKADGANAWSGGTILDPANGKTYKSKLELLDGGKKLGMSGCIAFLCRQQVWVRQ